MKRTQSRIVKMVALAIMTIAVSIPMDPSKNWLHLTEEERKLEYAIKHDDDSMYAAASASSSSVTAVAVEETNVASEEAPSKKRVFRPRPKTIVASMELEEEPEEPAFTPVTHFAARNSKVQRELIKEQREE
ncbi:MAG: hypothetical protein Q7R81_00380 [Candidatus Peregrinibacteria bacterium]|nr:hypothetical protein [Candidatus Peregrinibacteria bacterium]